MIDWTQGGFVWSVRRWVRREVSQHIKNNQTVRENRYPLTLRCMRMFMANRPFGWFVATYFSIALLIAFVEALRATLFPDIYPTQSTDSLKFTSLMTNAHALFITTQVTALGIISIAVGLVTLISQRQNVGRETQIYYHESLAQEVVASGIALLLVLCVQLFRPINLLISASGINIGSGAGEAVLASVHSIWLLINLAALAHFVSLSLRFVQPTQRSAIRNRYTANSVVPGDMTRRLLRAIYLSAGEELKPGGASNDRLLIVFGGNVGDDREIEIETTFSNAVILYDVWMRPLKWVLQRWWRRCEFDQLANNRQAGRLANATVWIAFNLSFDTPVRGRVVWCARRGGVPLTSFERFVARLSFRVRRAT